MGSWSDSEHRAELRRELVRVAMAPLVNVFRDPSGVDQQHYPLLAEAAEALQPGKWTEHDYHGALDQALRRAVELLSNEEGPHRYSTMSWREIAATLYGFANAEEASRVEVGNNKAYGRRNKFIWQQESPRIPESTFKNQVIKPCFTLVADALASLKPRSQQSKDEHSAAEGRSQSYIAREELEQRFHELRKRGHERFLFYGDAGTGKSTLARQLAGSSVSDVSEVVEFHAASEDLLLGEVVDYLYERGLQVGTGTKAALLRAVAKTMVGKDSPRVVLIDGVEDTTTAQLLLPPKGESDDFRSIVLFTSRERLLDGQVSTILVESMTKSEAVDMVRSRVPGVDADDATLLATELERRPLAIEHGCSLLKLHGGRESVQEFCEMLRLDIVELLDTAPQEVKLTAIYRRLSSRLDSDTQMSGVIDVLDLILSTSEFLDVDVLRRILLFRLDGTAGDEVVSIRAREGLVARKVEHAIEVLRRLALLRQAGHTTLLAVHKLTHSILRGIRGVTDRHAAEQVIGAARRFLDEVSWRPGVPIPHQWAHWVVYMRMILSVIEAFDNAKLSELKVPRTLAFAARCARQFGDLELLNGVFSAYARFVHMQVERAERKELAIELLALGWGERPLALNGDDAEDRVLAREPLFTDAEHPYIYDATATEPLLPIFRNGLISSDYAAVETPMGSSSVGHSARVQQFLGSITYERGSALRADEHFETSFDLASQLHDLEGKSVAMETARRAIELHIKTARETDLSRWTTRVESLESDESWASLLIEDRPSDLATRATAANVKLRDIFAHAFVSGVDEVQEDVVRLVSEYARLDHIAWALYHPLWLSVRYNHCRAASLLGVVPRDLWRPSNPPAAEQIYFGLCYADALLENLHSDIGTHYRSFFCVPAHLALAKILPAHLRQHGKDVTESAYSSARTALAWAKTIRTRWPNYRYWYADALTAAFALARLAGRFGSGFLGRLAELTDRALVAIDRRDRWAVIEAVGSGRADSSLLLGD